MFKNSDFVLTSKTNQIYSKIPPSKEVFFIMKDKIINEIASNMVNILNNDQLGKLKDALEYSLHNCNIVQSTNETEVMNNKDEILEEIKEALREMYNNSTFIYSVGFGDFMTQ